MPHAEAVPAGPAPVRALLARSLGVEPRDAEPLALGLTMFFLLFAGYFLLRPVRETMGIAGGVHNLQWPFTGTFLATLAAMPAFGWIAARVALVGTIGNAGLLLLSARLVAGTVVAARRLQSWRDRNPLDSAETGARSEPLGGSPLAGASQVLRSPFLLGTALFVMLLATTSTFLYFEQARVVEETFPDRADQTRVFGLIDAIVQALALLTQLFLSGRIARRFGVGALLFTVVPVQAKYKAKNFIDTVVYRGSDALGGWLKTLIGLATQHPAAGALIGAAIALAWAGAGAWLARAQRASCPASQVPRRIGEVASRARA